MLILWDDGSDSAAYDDACWAKVFNARRPKHRRPRAVTKARSKGDVLTAVRLAIHLNLRVAVRSGGHSFETWSIQENSILVDLCEYKQVNVDPVGRIVTATPSVTSREINDVLACEDLFFPGGHCPDVGLGGFLLQGGMGWNCAVSEYNSPITQLRVAGRPPEKVSYTVAELGLGMRVPSGGRRGHGTGYADLL